ncbi:MAPEG family protein [Alteromonas sp. CYL-A6]|uniref:MAPEG family protein n=1 Tax=Alteromonas nitratireducens TaxID=3390813 RepID=UPI0034AA2044
MSATATALAGYIVWTILLIFLMIAYRAKLVVSDKHSVVFKPDGTDADSLCYRITRAHANCVESAVFVVGTLVLSLAVGAQSVTDPLAMWLLYARLFQSVIHMISGATWAIGLRGLAFFVQLVICGYWLIELLTGVAK